MAKQNNPVVKLPIRTESEDKNWTEARKKWGAAVINAGFVVFPDVIIERQTELGLDPLDLNILLHLVRHWWFKDLLPRPSVQTIAECVNRSRRHVQRRLAEMERKGILRREARGKGPNGSKPNFYHLEPLARKAKPLAEEILEDKQRQKNKERARRRQKPADNVVRIKTK